MKGSAAGSLSLRESRVLVALASVLVPRQYRADWRAEWNAEMWHAWNLLQERGESRAATHRQLREWSLGSFADAVWYRFGAFDTEVMAGAWRRLCRGPGFCLGMLAAVLLLLAMLSGLLPKTRSVLFPLSYTDAEKVATVAEGSVAIAMRAGPRLKWTREWQSDSRTIQAIATYVWRRRELTGLPGRNTAGLNAQVSARFFSVLGVTAAAGHVWTGYGTDACTGCAVLSHNFAVSAYGDPVQAIGRRIVVDGRQYQVAGVLPQSFWFLSRRIAVWTPATAAQESDPLRRTGVVVRLAADATPRLAEAELLSLVRRKYPMGWDSIVTVSPVQRRVRSVLFSYGLGLLLASVIVLAGVHLRIPLFASTRHHRAGFGWLAPFFAVKTCLVLLLVLVAGLEFTPSSSITMIGGTDLATEPLSTWLFLVGCMGALSWSIHDQRRRCRVCVRRLGLCAQVGCSGCLLLNWAGTEMVCIEGHGMLHVPEMLSSWNEPEHWTSLDESWQELFAART